MPLPALTPLQYLVLHLLFVGPQTGQQLREALRYSLLAPGKRLRPMLVLLAEAAPAPAPASEAPSDIPARPAPSPPKLFLFLSVLIRGHYHA